MIAFHLIANVSITVNMSDRRLTAKSALLSGLHFSRLLSGYGLKRPSRPSQIDEKASGYPRAFTIIKHRVCMHG
jgi:hypothetical protein